jgi:uncharacterized protein
MISLTLIPVSIFAGLIGSILGLGGGVVITPVLTLIFGIDIRYAIGASLISIIATSSGAASKYLRDHLTNVRVAILLEMGTVFGAMTGFLISNWFKTSWLYVLFGGFLLFSAVMMFRQKSDPRAESNHPWADYLKLDSKFFDQGRWVNYKVAGVPWSLGAMYFAGIFSALLGIGSGIFKMLSMDSAMKLPMKVSAATSNFMIGVTAAASAGAYFLRGDIRPEIASPVAIGIIIGSWMGARIMPRLNTLLLRKIFIFLMLFVATQMIMKGINLWN